MCFYCFYVFSDFTAIVLMCLICAFYRILIKITYLLTYLIQQPNDEKTNRKKSSRQRSWPSRLKHLSCRKQRQSAHWTHAQCHFRSSTFSRNLSTIGRWHPAQTTTISTSSLVDVQDNIHVTFTPKLLPLTDTIALSVSHITPCLWQGSIERSEQ